MTSDFGSSSVVADSLSKVYRLGEHVSLRSTLGRFSRNGQRTNEAEFRALDKVSFQVGQGECYGIIGHNGSGKSTLLQVLAGITVPTEGVMSFRGRVLPLLAVGTGFHPELTGRENIELFGTVLGVSRTEIRAQVDRIAEFAEIERHLDTPNKRYSDGMQARLSFAIAILFPADIYLFDEVLAVVDGEFRERCLAEIEQLHRSGRTVIFVSHDLEQVGVVCDRVMWMRGGAAHMVGDAQTVLPLYEAERG